MTRTTLGSSLIALGLVFFSAASTQGLELEVGFQLGLGMTKASYEASSLLGDELDANSKFGPGVFGGFPVSVLFSGASRTSLETGVFVWQRGGETEFRGPIADELGNIVGESSSVADWKLSYLTLPVTGKYRFSEGRTGFYLKSGLEAAFLLSAKCEQTSDIEGLDPSKALEEDVTEDFTVADFSALVAVGYEFRSANRSWFVEILHAQGWKDVLRPSDAAFAVDVYNRSFGLSLGVLF